MKFLETIALIFAVVANIQGQLIACAKDGTEITYTLDTIADYSKSETFNPEANLAIYIFSVLPESTSMFTEYHNQFPIMKAAYQKTPYNFMYYSSNSYENITAEASKFYEDAQFIETAIERMIQNGLNYQKIELVGFSMGAQIAGLVGKKFQQTFPGLKLPVIYSLGAMIIPIPERLDASDATYVMNMRTEYRFNDPFVQAHTNFYFNKKLEMPQCYFADFNFNDHRCGSEKAQLIWAEAVESQNPKIFGGIKCDNMEAFENSQCENIVAYVNPYAPHDMSGNYFVETLGTIGNRYENKNGPFYKKLQRSKYLQSPVEDLD